MELKASNKREGCVVIGYKREGCVVVIGYKSVWSLDKREGCVVVIGYKREGCVVVIGYKREGGVVVIGYKREGCVVVIGYKREGGVVIGLFLLPLQLGACQIHPLSAKQTSRYQGSDMGKGGGSVGRYQSSGVAIMEEVVLVTACTAVVYVRYVMCKGGC